MKRKTDKKRKRQAYAWAKIPLPPAAHFPYLTRALQPSTVCPRAVMLYSAGVWDPFLNLPSCTRVPAPADSGNPLVGYCLGALASATVAAKSASSSITKLSS